VNDESAVALVLAAGLVLLGAATAYYQVRGLRALSARKHVPSDEHAYLRNRYRRRLLTAAILAALGGLIGGAYLSGMERRADKLGEARPAPADADPADKPKMTDAEKQFVRFWTVYWTLVLVLVFLLVGLAMLDALSTRRYWLTLYRQIREEHQTKLRRDLAVYKRHKEQTRGGRFGNRLGGAGGKAPDGE
jgi:uncharacterized membrane protein YgcG